MDDIDAGKLGIDPDLIEQVLEKRADAAKRKRPLRRTIRYIGAPLSFVHDVCRLTEGRTTLLVALCIYRRTHVCNSRTVTLPSVELAELGIARKSKRDALAKLQRARLIKVKNAVGRTSRITLTWRPD
jgi:hypothetical protein